MPLIYMEIYILLDAKVLQGNTAVLSILHSLIFTVNKIKDFGYIKVCYCR